jgi:hypothetical protein
MKCVECFGQDACNGVALREFNLGCSIDSMPLTTPLCAGSFGLFFDVFVDSSFAEKFYVLGHRLDSDSPSLCSFSASDTATRYTV